MLQRSTALFVSVLLAAYPAVCQQPPAVQRIRIFTLEGQNAVNYIPIRTATAPVVEVRDENDRPIEGASVTFTAPATGPGAVFERGERTQTTITNFRGQAGVRGYTINDKPGRFAIEVTARYQDSVARVMITQANSMEAIPTDAGSKKKSHKTMWILLGIAAGAGAGAGVYFATREGNNPINVGIGSISVGGPR